MRDGLVEVPILNVDASAGFGAIAESETAHTRFGFDERWLGKLTRAKSASLSIIHVHGESMEPTLRDGDEVLVDASDQGSRLRDGIYVLRADDALVVTGVGGLGLLSILKGFRHGANTYRESSDLEGSIIDGVETAVVGTIKAGVDTAELAFKVATSRPSRFAGRMVLKGLSSAVNAIDRRLEEK